MEELNQEKVQERGINPQNVLETLAAAGDWWKNVNGLLVQFANATPTKVDDAVVKYLSLILQPTATAAQQIIAISAAIKESALTPEQKATAIYDAVQAMNVASAEIQKFFLTELLKRI